VAPIIPNPNPIIYIQWGIILDLIATIIVTRMIWESIKAKIGPAGLPVATAEFAKKTPTKSMILPKNPIHQSCHTT